MIQNTDNVESKIMMHNLLQQYIFRKLNMLFYYCYCKWYYVYVEEFWRKTLKMVLK